MASGKFQTYSQLLLNRLFNGTTWSIPGTLFIALFTVSPTVSTTGTEASGGSYARASVVSNTTNWPVISGTTTTITNGTIITFPTATANWSAGANMVSAGIWDSLTTGILYYWGDVTVAKPVNSGDTATFPIGNLSVQEL